MGFFNFKKNKEEKQSQPTTSTSTQTNSVNQPATQSKPTTASTTVQPKPASTSTTAKPTPASTTAQSKPASAPPKPDQNRPAPTGMPPGGHRPFVNTTGELQVVIGGKPVKFTTGKPYLEGAEVLVPIRELAEHFGATVAWDEKTRKVTLTKDDDIVQIEIDSKTAVVNGKTVQLSAVPVVVDSRIFMPIKFLADNLDAEYKYDASTKVASIS